MNFQELLTDLNIKYKDFIEEAARVRAFAPFVGKTLSNKETYSSMMIHDISDSIIDLDIPDIDMIDLIFQVYDIAPSYSVLMYLLMRYNILSIDLKEYVMKKYADYFYQDDEHLSVPIAYSLWVDYFEDVERVEFSYNQLYKHMRNEYRDVKKLVEISGPVPYRLKEKFYKAMVADRSYHELLYEGIICSVSDVYGQIESTDALRLLNLLEIDRNTTTYIELIKRLGK